jgi:hypothetical protein
MPCCYTDKCFAQIGVRINSAKSVPHLWEETKFTNSRQGVHQNDRWWPRLSHYKSQVEKVSCDKCGKVIGEGRLSENRGADTMREEPNFANLRQGIRQNDKCHCHY